MITLKHTPILAILFIFLTSGLYQDHSKYEAKVNTYKEECKQDIKPARYESSIVTYYNTSKNSQTKSLEILLISSGNYVFSVNGKLCNSNVEMKIYDNPSDNKKRNLLKTIELKNQMVNFESNDLNIAFRKMVKNADRLKKVFIEYEISEGSESQDAIILVLGLK